MLKINMTTEVWREISRFAGQTDGEIDERADALCEAVLCRLSDAGVDYRRDDRQRIGIGMAVQSVDTQAERDAFDAAVDAELAAIAAKE